MNPPNILNLQIGYPSADREDVEVSYTVFRKKKKPIKQHRDVSHPKHGRRLLDGVPYDKVTKMAAVDQNQIKNSLHEKNRDDIYMKQAITNIKGKADQQRGISTSDPRFRRMQSEKLISSLDVLSKKYDLPLDAVKSIYTGGKMM